jgi:CHAD domain-containing protein
MADRVRAPVMKKTADKLWRPDLGVNENVARRLPKLAKKYFKSGHRALDKERDWKDVHSFRLETKKFRYTLELFRPQYGPGLEKRIDELKHIQTLLGDANDYVVTAGLLEPVAGSEPLRSRLAHKAETKVRELRSWWQENLGTDAVERRWILYFQRLGTQTSAAKKALLSPKQPASHAVRSSRAPEKQPATKR